jgi:hypothetical protein
VCPRAGLDAAENTKISSPYWESNTGSTLSRSYTDSAIPVPVVHKISNTALNLTKMGLISCKLLIDSDIGDSDIGFNKICERFMGCVKIHS